MASPIDLAAAIANRKKQVSGGAIPAPANSTNASPTTPTGFDMTTPGAQALGQSTMNAGSTTPPGFKFTPMETPAAQALGQRTMGASSTTPEGFKFTPMVTPAAQALGQRIMGADNHVNAPAANAANPDLKGAQAPGAASPGASSPTPAIPEPGGFNYSSMTRSSGQMADEARARAALQIDLRAQAAKDALTRYQANAETQRKGQRTNLAGMEEGNRYRFAGSNLGTSGFMAGANAVAQGATQDNIGQIDQGVRQAVDTTNDQLSGLERLRGSAETATLAELERLNNDVQFKGADLNSLIQGRNLAMTSTKLRLPMELQGLGLANQGAQFSLDRGRGLLPYELGNADVNLQRNQGTLPFDVGNAATNYQRNGQMLPLDVQKAKIGVAGDALQLDTGTKMQPYTLEGARLGNERAAQVNRMGELEYIIANDPDVGKRAQAQVEMQTARKQLEVMDANIKASTAKALSGSGGGFTAWQQYQMIRDQKGDGEKGAATKAQAQEKARDKLTSSFRSDYTVSQPGADLWADFMDIATSPKADGTMANKGELGKLLADMLNNPTVPANDKGWAQTMFWAGQGEQWAQDELNSSKYRKKPVAQEDPYGPK